MFPLQMYYWCTLLHVSNFSIKSLYLYYVSIQMTEQEGALRDLSVLNQALQI